MIMGSFRYIDESLHFMAPCSILFAGQQLFWKDCAGFSGLRLFFSVVTQQHNPLKSRFGVEIRWVMCERLFGLCEKIRFLHLLPLP
jgi:hypothetical protein